MCRLLHLHISNKYIYNDLMSKYEAPDLINIIDSIESITYIKFCGENDNSQFFQNVRYYNKFQN